MAAPQVGIYTTICLVAIKLILIVLEGFLRRYLSVDVHQRASHLQNYPIGPHTRCFKQLERVQLKLEALCKLHGRFGNQILDSDHDVNTLKSDPDDDQKRTNTRRRSKRRRSKSSLTMRELAERISNSLEERRNNSASDDLDEMASRLSKVASYIDRDLTGSGDTALLDHKTIRQLQEDSRFLRKCLGSPGEILVDDQHVLARIKERQWRFAWIFRMSGLMMGAVSIVLGGFTFVGAKGVRLDEEDQCWVADADIIGDGVRAGTWSQAAILFLSTFLGSFHHSHTAIKELGSGLLGMHVALALAFLGPLVQGELSPVDAILGSMILDVQNSALSMQLMEKETLAARWQVGAVMVAQLLGLITIGIIMHSFNQDNLSVDSS
ncbi:hypothetical protein CDV31_009969 [Fusarium ambrosium]|uniref:Uncharacterized protein n=1 Tax=Fusarium ambrosium TaxID=131363 RepID=A0A428TRL3_9HYPO|nr:hypothetical protein CDV31_009969 [Fusarium ambrosium]